MDIVRVAALVLATVTTGLVTGLFWGYAISVVISMRALDDRTYVELKQRINRDIQNGRFFLVFLGSVAVSALAAVLLLGGDRGSVLLPAVVAFVLNLVAFFVTGGGNIPLVQQLAAAGRATDPTAVRRRYEEPWNRLNVVRMVLHLGAFGALCWALVAFGAL
jgi:uncharacterized membrane protein